ncbi:MAG: glycosyltransferase [Myxococcota bacterium]
MPAAGAREAVARVSELGGRVVHVDLARGWRGGQAQLRALVAAAPPLAVVVARDGPLHRALLGDGVRVVPLPVAGRWTPGGASALQRALDALAGEGSAVVAAHDGHAAALCDRVRLRAPLVVHRRVDFAPSRAGYARYRRAARVVAVSEAVARVLGRGGVRRVVVVHDGVEPGPVAEAAPDRAGVRAALGLGPEAPLVLALGALVPHKGHRVLIEAMPLLPGVAVAVLGEGPLRGPLLARARRRGVADRLHLVGFRGDRARWLRSADAFAHPSLEEGLGQAVIEAHVAGLPVVASRAGGVPELGIGALLPPGDPVALAVALRAALAEGIGPPRSTAFTVSRMAARTLEAYAGAR